MALRVCNSILRKSIRFSYNGHVNLPLEIAIPFLETGGVLRRPRVNGQIVTHFSPVCLISSEAVLTKLPKDKATETHDSTCHNPASILPNCGNNPNQPENKKVLKVAIIGAPNAGKSSLSNQLLGRKVFAVSKKVHTTRTQARGILNEDNIQIILLDTPGLTTPSKVKRHQLEKSLLVDPWNSVQEADLVLVLVDVSEKWTRDALDSEVLRVLAQNPDIPSVLVLNKVDLLKNKSMLLDITAGLTEGTVNGKKLRVRSVGKPLSEGRGKGAAVEPATLSLREQETEAFNTLQNTAVDATTEGLSKNNLKQLRPRQGWPHFLDVFMLSALDAEEVEALKRYLVVEAKPGSWQYRSGVLTDQSPQEICTNSVREKLLELLPQEVPYTVSQTVEMWQEGENGDLDILIKLHVKKESHMKMLIGQGGQTISRIAREASEDLMNVFLCNVKLKLTVKIKK